MMDVSKPRRSDLRTSCSRGKGAADVLSAKCCYLFPLRQNGYGYGVLGNHGTENTDRLDLDCDVMDVMDVMDVVRMTVMRSR